MSHSITDRTIALAAVFQATKLVQEIANTGQIDEQEFETCIQSLFHIDVDSTEEAYGDHSKLRTGFSTLIEQLSGKSVSGMSDKTKNIHVTKYTACIMILERRLMKNQNMLKTISDGIDRARNQAEHFSILHDNVIASLAHVYSETISNIKPRNNGAGRTCLYFQSQSRKPYPCPTAFCHSRSGVMAPMWWHPLATAFPKTINDRGSKTVMPNTVNLSTGQNRQGN